MTVPDNCSIRLVVVDNNSNVDDKVELRKINSESFHLELIELEQNIGYFPALNVGIDFCRTGIDEQIIIGNNDLKYRYDFILKLESLNVDNNVLVISPDVVTTDGVHQNPLSTRKLSRLELLKEDVYYSNYYLSRFLILTKGIFLKLYSKENLDTKLKNHCDIQMVINRGIGACYCLTNTFFKHYSKLDDRVFLWGEEALLSNQVEQVNGCILYAPSLVVEHAESGTVKKMLTRDRYERVKQSYKIYREYL
ncbi:glycosyltransferase family 2 protein [Shewanella sp. SG41-3]|uniref:glycosyltransferase family 2 protein n=1 Tax=Shewanella sp. SG41-3 TaxID=2760977 RepID=UPI001602826B|nr:glycosyltransferase [Shewanella sp. SG41-3]MBB1474350.1 glycosyltransferase [Shewanella sp. SG41-3]